LKKPLLIIFFILTADQVSKFWIKTNMTLGQEFRVLGDWFIIHFTENYGMAFGLEFAGEKGKLVLTLFRIVASVFIFVYLYHLVKRKEHPLMIVSISMIFAGAMGNIIDSVFYGLLFSASTFFEAAQFLPEGEGYASIFHGRVVDMLYFPLIKGTWPSWFPWWGGNDFIFFRPVFNIADSAITTGVFILLVFQKKFFKTQAEESPEPPTLAEQEKEQEK
jgi:signal peptidase II